MTEAVEAAVAALIQAGYKPRKDWYHETFVCGDPDCHVESRGGQPFSATPGFKVQVPSKPQPVWALSLFVGKVPGEQSAVLCPHCNHEVLQAQRAGKAKDLGLEVAMPVNPDEATRMTILSSRKAVNEALGVITVPLIAVLKTLEAKLTAQDAVLASDDPAAEAKFQATLDAPTVCAISGVSILHTRDAYAVNEAAIKNFIEKTLRWLHDHREENEARSRMEVRLALARKVFNQVINRGRGEPVRFISRDVAKMISQVIGPVSIWLDGNEKTFYPTLRAETLLKIIARRTVKEADKSATRLGEFFGKDLSQPEADSTPDPVRPVAAVIPDVPTGRIPNHGRRTRGDRGNRR